MVDFTPRRPICRLLSSRECFLCRASFGGGGLQGVTPISSRGSWWGVAREGGGGEGDTRLVGGGARTGTVVSLVVGGAACFRGVVILTIPIIIFVKSETWRVRIKLSR